MRGRKAGKAKCSLPGQAPRNVIKGGGCVVLDGELVVTAGVAATHRNAGQ